MSTPQEEAALAGRMAHEMIVAMEPHHDRRHWQRSSSEYLLGRLEDELDELRKAVEDGGNVWKEAADVANFAAMIADRASDG